MTAEPVVEALEEAPEEELEEEPAGAPGGALKVRWTDEKSCRHCGKIHRVPDVQCWKLDANAHLRPDNYITPPPGFGGKK